jgi:glycosyltransferase involved in cell wall biosynthesis
VLLVSVDSTGGWTVAARELAAAFEAAGASTAIARTGSPPRVRTYAATDLVEALMARRTARRALAGQAAGAVVYCGIVAALLWPARGAIWLDAPTAENRPGRHGIWQRTVERRRLAAAPVVMTMSHRSLQALPGVRPDAVVVPVPVDASAATVPAGARDIDALAYVGNPEKKRLDHVLATWERVRRPGERLVLAGLDDGIGARDGLEIAGRLPVEEYRALLRRARVFVSSSVREDHGIAQLEALADGCLLVSTPAPGPYPALDLARALDPRLVDADLGRALRAALDDPPSGYAERAAAMLEPFSRVAVARTLRNDVLPALLRA